MSNMIILGPPGSGKDTQIEEMAKYVRFELISGGDIVRSLAVTNPAIEDVMDRGGLVDDSILLASVDKKLSGIEKNVSVVFDGFPRTLHQAEALNELLMHHDRTLDTVIYIALDESAIVNRLTKRMVCSLCGHNVHAAGEKCSICGGDAIRRHDDEPAIIINRVQTYLENTLPLISYYRNKGILIEINGDQSVTAVAKEIKEKLGE